MAQRLPVGITSSFSPSEKSSPVAELLMSTVQDTVHFPEGLFMGILMISGKISASQSTDAPSLSQRYRPNWISGRSGLTADGR